MNYQHIKWDSEPFSDSMGWLLNNPVVKEAGKQQMLSGLVIWGQVCEGI